MYSFCIILYSCVYINLRLSYLCMFLACTFWFRETQFHSAVQYLLHSWSDNQVHFDK